MTDAARTEQPAQQRRPEKEVEMPFFEHLAELRTRLMRALWGLIPGIGIAWWFKEDLLELLTRPLLRAWQAAKLGAPSLHFASPVDPVLAYLKLSLVVGAILASPWVFWQCWAFVSPGLYAKEKRFAIPFVLASTVCFAGGAFFGYLVVFPAAFETLLEFAGELPSVAGSIRMRLQPTIMIDQYLDFATQLLLAFGITFEVPVVTTFLALTGVVDWRALLAFSRWWVLISSIAAAVLTPGADVTSQLLLMGPLVVLYFVGILLAALVRPQKKSA